jgi:hypothetical protein
MAEPTFPDLRTFLDQLRRAGDLAVVEARLREDGKIDWTRVLQGDRFAALLGIRIATHGPDFDFDISCGRCDAEEPITWTLDLRELERRPYPDATIAAYKSGQQLSTMIGGKRVLWTPVTGAEEKRIQKDLEKARKSDPRSRRAPFSPLVDGLIARIEVEGLDAGATRTWILDMDGAELAHLRTVMEDANGGVETTIQVRHNLPDCTGVTSVELPFSSEAFWLPRTKPVPSGATAPTSSSQT